MNPSCLQYRLTDEEQQTFDETGMLAVEDALDHAQVAELTSAVDQAFERQLNEGHDARTALFYPNFIPDSPLFADLVDYERILLHLDVLHGDRIPGISIVPTCSRHVLFDVAHAAIAELDQHGVDLLAVELLLDMLHTARSKELP